MPTAQQLINQARGTPIGTQISAGIGATFLAIYISWIDFVQALAGLITKPLDALGINSANVVTAFVGGAARIIQQGAITTQQSLLPGQAWAVGPLTFGFSVAAIGVALFIMSQLLALGPTSDTLPFTFTDLPLVGVDEEEDG